MTPRACGPYRARTKGKTESGVKDVKRNALAGRSFATFAALEAHLAAWMDEADGRVHGTTHETPRERFDRDERAALRALPKRPPRAREQRLRRRVANDAYVDVDTVRHSVPHGLVRDHVEVVVGESRVRIFHGKSCVADHRRSREPHSVVTDPKHHETLGRQARHVDAVAPVDTSLRVYGRTLADDEAVAHGDARVSA